MSDLVRDYVDVLSERAEKLKEMINSLFSLAKASSGNIELHPEKFELNRLVEQIFADMHDHVKESELQFVKQFTEENTEIISDNMYFYRICQNLIENALKYSAKHTRVFVKTYQKSLQIICVWKSRTPQDIQWILQRKRLSSGFFVGISRGPVREMDWDLRS